jgi:hypothetical protein
MIFLHYFFTSDFFTSSLIAQVSELVPETTAVYKLPAVLRPSNAITKLERVGNNSTIANFLIIKSSNQNNQ